MALSAPRQIHQLGWDTKPPTRAAGVAAGAVIFHGAMCGPDANGYMAPASTTVRPKGVADLEIWNDLVRSGQQTPGVEYETPGRVVDNSTGADGARQIVVRHGVFAMKNKAGDEVTQAMVGSPVYSTDDETVQATGGGVVAGILHGFSDSGLPLILIESAATE
jgi:hypothetical protein